MALERKLRTIGGSLMVSLPSDVANIFGFKDGDMVEFEIDSTTESIIVKKIEE